MAIPTFIQNTRINQVIYQIRDGELLISHRALLGKFKDYKIPLQQLDPDYRPLVTWNYPLLVIPLAGAVVTGAILCAGLPLFPVSDYAVDPSLFPLVFILCVAGAAFSIFSFLGNEPRRWWSLIGLILSLLPSFFY